MHSIVGPQRKSGRASRGPSRVNSATPEGLARAEQIVRVLPNRREVSGHRGSEPPERPARSEQVVRRVPNPGLRRIRISERPHATVFGTPRTTSSARTRMCRPTPPSRRILPLVRARHPAHFLQGRRVVPCGEPLSQLARYRPRCRKLPAQLLVLHFALAFYSASTVSCVMYITVTITTPTPTPTTKTPNTTI